VKVIVKESMEETFKRIIPRGPVFGGAHGGRGLGMRSSDVLASIRSYAIHTQVSDLIAHVAASGEFTC
jgi:hypothetical protein